MAHPRLFIPVIVLLPEVPAEEKHKDRDHAKEDEYVCPTALRIPNTHHFINEECRNEQVCDFEKF